MNTKATLRFLMTVLIVLIAITVWPVSASADGTVYQCEPTVEDEMGPFYKPGMPYRTSVGTGYLLLGTVKAANDCSPIPAAMIELWMTGPDGHYGDTWRATLFSADDGTYYFVSHAPTDFGSRRPHIHIRVTAESFAPLVTQHYPLNGAGEGMFDLVLIQNRGR
jgi:protocatechuate 3,4-dioxygenase beta subunit